MVKTQQLSEKWIKASILGTIWASSEIVLGSFLHNLRVPFSGNILTAIGIIILISASYKWNDRGLFWRAGVICALLKTLSPSAVIFGPFIAILSEAVLLELSVRAFGRTIPGIIIGAILAMSWNLIYKVFKMILFYGNNIIDVYINLMQYTERQIGVEFDVVWAPLIILLIIQIIFGVFAALIGIRTGTETAGNLTSFKNNRGTKSFLSPNKQNNFPYSVNWLVLNVFFMVVPLVLVGRINFMIWGALIISIATLWAFRYKRALRQLVRPRLWIVFILVTMLTALVLGRLQSDAKSMTEALVIGVEMNLRAMLLIMGFSVLGTELYNPKIRDYFARSYFKQLPLALQLSLESLPMMIANTPDLKSIVKNPTLFVHHFMSFADFRLKEIHKRANFKKKIFIVTGEIGGGKTACIRNLVELFQINNISVSGIYSSKVSENGKTTGYNVVAISSGKTVPFLRASGKSPLKQIGRFFIDDQGLDAGNEELTNRATEIVIIDEIGRLELAGDGWSGATTQLINNAKSHLILSVRREVVDEVVDRFSIRPQFIMNISKEKCDDLYGLIIEELGIVKQKQLT